MQAQVLISTHLDRTFTYEVPEGVLIGQIIFVPFSHKIRLGVVWSFDSSSFEGSVKNIERLTQFHLPPSILEFIKWVAHYTCSPLGAILKMVLNLSLGDFEKIIKKPLVYTAIKYEFSHIFDLTAEQKTALDCINDNSYEFSVFLLDGVTGSGKTEVYTAAIEQIIQQNKQSLVLLPEISLTLQSVQRFEKRFGVTPCLWHSGIKPSEKRQLWQRIINGENLVVIGARSALFLPFTNLGIIVVDEEHDPSYKQEEQILYHARDMAIVRAKLSKIPIILASATPSLESLVNVQNGRYKHLTLENRTENASLPQVNIVDMRGQPKNNWISAPLTEEIHRNLEKKEQILLFLNRRGYAPLTLCRKCGYRYMCPACSTWLVYHKNTEQLCCHQCGFYKKVSSTCEECKTDNTLIPCGPGVERIYEEIKAKFTQASIFLASSDKIGTVNAVNDMIDQIQSRQIDIIIGTQMLAKGHHFPYLTLVGIIDADLGLNGGDFKAGERTYQLLHQVAGRAGREELKGQVFLQTYLPDNRIMQALSQYDRNDFYSCEIEDRSFYKMPPFSRLASTIISGLNENLVKEAAFTIVKQAPQLKGITILGPVPAILSRLKARYRWRILIKAEKNISLQSVIQQWIKKVKISSTVRVVIDIDPQTFI